MKIVCISILLMLSFALVSTLSAQSFNLQESVLGQDRTTMQSSELELRLKSSTDSEGTRATDPEGAYILNPYPYGYRDVQPPTAPESAQCVALSDTEVMLTFQASTDNVRVLGYYIYRDDVQVGSTGTESYRDSGLGPMTSHKYDVVARDKSGNISVHSTAAYVTTLDSTTANMPPQFLIDPYVRSVGDALAVIYFQANKPVDARIDYGPDASYGSVQNAAGSSEYTVTITGLQAGSQYHYRVVLDPLNTALPSADQAFYTLPSADTTPPSFVELPYVSYVGSTGALIVWQTDEEAMGAVEYGTASPGQYVITETQFAVNHSVSISGLDPDTVYCFHVSATDRFGRGPAYSPDDAFVTLAANDTTPPVITGARTAYRSNDRALITWTTDEPADSRIWFGTTSGSYDRMEIIAEFTMSHQVELLNLLPNTTYYFVIRAADFSGNLSAQTAERTFTTRLRADTTPPLITRIAVAAGQTEAVVRWTTNELADSVVAYGEAPGVYLYQTVDPELLQDHEINLSGLAPDHTYYYQVISQDASGNRTVSTERRFTTLAEGEIGPLAVSNLTVTSTAARITFQWQTNNAATTELQYRSAEDTAWTLIDRTNLVRSHLVRLPLGNLSPGTYYFRVAGTDNYAQSVEVTLDELGQPLQFVVQ